MKKLCISLIISSLDVGKTLTAITTLMHNFIANFVKVLDIYKEFAGNRVNELGNLVPVRAEPQARLRAMPSAAEIM